MSAPDTAPVEISRPGRIMWRTLCGVCSTPTAGEAHCEGPFGCVLCPRHSDRKENCRALEGCACMDEDIVWHGRPGGAS